MIRRPPRSTLSSSSAASDVYKRQTQSRPRYRPPRPCHVAGSGVWVNKWVRLQRGKYEGRRALIVGVTTKKFRVRVEGVEHQLEFYPSMFKLEPQEGRQRVQEGEEEAEAMQVDAGSSGTANTPAVPTHQALAQICCNQSSTNQSLSGAFYY
eukprot:TRINITY_DN1220_c0_g1_i1.p1 TRINITY_DN1220_c0_g1~~TRINITY_DN1220_c0_g1_i1.p1  ORF type:complete len:152 (-),score=32.21 TRINITY_DN1220_c0_g1_i1:184-639(-)